MTRLLEEYKNSIQSKIAQDMAIKNLLAVPKLEKIAINVGWGELRSNEALQKNVADALGLITGQKPQITRAKKAIAGFKLRQHDPIGYRVTLRGQRMYDFLDRLITYVFPRLRDFQGISTSGFDGHGNFSFGLREQTVFPEVPFQANDRTWGMQITLVTTAKKDTEARALLTELGFPFAKPRNNS